MAFSTQDSDEVLSEINVTPLVDVMLVLLVVFIVTAPLLTNAIPINLPKTEAVAPVEQKDPLVVSIDGAGKVFINKDEIQPDLLEFNLQAAKAKEMQLVADLATERRKIEADQNTKRAAKDELARITINEPSEDEIAQASAFLEELRYQVNEHKTKWTTAVTLQNDIKRAAEAFEMHESAKASLEVVKAAGMFLAEKQQKTVNSLMEHGALLMARKKRQAWVLWLFTSTQCCGLSVWESLCSGLCAVLLKALVLISHRKCSVLLRPYSIWRKTLKTARLPNKQRISGSHRWR